MENWEKQFDAVRQYILGGPFPSDHPAIVAALQGIDQEVKRRHRDSKLLQKFSSRESNSLTTSNHVVMGDVEMDAVKVEVPTDDTTKPDFANSESEVSVTMTDDWQDVVADETIPSNNTTDEETSALGMEMAKTVVALLASHQVLCSSPTASLAVALHAVLLQCDFICTGVPETTPPVGGFAAPIRDLPGGQFLPAHWEGLLRGIQFRYRNRKVSGSYVLSVTSSLESDAMGSMVQVSLTGSPLFSNVDPFEFSVLDHMNLNSWNMAQQKSNGKISPVLHYKALAALLVKFMHHFHLPPKEEEKVEVKVDHAQAWKDMVEAEQRAMTLNSNFCAPLHQVPTSKVEVKVDHAQILTDFYETQQRAGASINDTYGYNANQVLASLARHPADGPQHGQFDGDLYPLDGYYSPPLGGNLMGPNHPMFSGVDPQGGPPLGMQPRFDPFGPPGGPTEPPPHPFQVDPPGKAPAFPPRGGTGNPNNDLAIPPPFGGNNMFL